MPNVNLNFFIHENPLKKHNFGNTKLQPVSNANYLFCVKCFSFSFIFHAYLWSS